MEEIEGIELLQSAISLFQFNLFEITQYALKISMSQNKIIVFILALH